MTTCTLDNSTGAACGNDNTELIELVRAAQCGDRQAFGDLFERFERHVMAIALRRLGDFAEAQELCQDVFIQAMKKISQLREPEAFAGWLRSITNRMAINRMIRRPADRAIETETLDRNCVETRTPLTMAIDGERAREVRRGLKALRRLDRETLVAFYVRGKSLIEMSDDFDAPVGTIKRRLHVARKRLAKHVEAVAAV
jgi:RNA polymerase sigma-70 factor (ECF subfamily)